MCHPTQYIGFSLKTGSPYKKIKCFALIVVERRLLVSYYYGILGFFSSTCNFLLKDINYKFRFKDLFPWTLEYSRLGL
jgi:hypothetical protein